MPGAIHEVYKDDLKSHLAFLALSRLAKIGADGMQQSDQMSTMKNAMRGMAVLMVPFTYQMPCAVFCYWSTANAFSLGQTLTLKVGPE